jgi:hypothetical protein
MRTTAAALTPILVLCAAAAQAAVPLAGRFGHAHTATDDETVWQITQLSDDGYQVYQADEPDASATLLDDSGRAAFWLKMHWDAGTGAGARCLNWGEPMADSLQDLFDPPSTDAPVLRRSVLCHVPSAQRQQIPWLADNRSDWFYYDSLSGVMEITPLP